MNSITIAGGGILGLFTALTLARRGYSLAIHDPAGFPAHNASFIAGGMLAPFSEIEHMGGQWIDAGLEGIVRWRELAAEPDADFDFHERGSILLSHAQDRYILDRFHTALAEDHSHSPHWHTVNGEDIAALEPALAGRFSGGLNLKPEAHLDPRCAMLHLCALLTDLPNVTMTPEVADMDTSGLLIDCRGSAAIADDPDLRGVKGETIVVRNRDFTLSRPVRLMHPRYPLYIVPRADNLFMIGATIIESENAAHVGLRSALELLSALYSLHPSFGDAEIIEINAGIRPSYPDNLPRITIAGNRISCNGSFRHGYLLAPIMAQCVADRLDGRENRFMTLLCKGVTQT